MIYSFLYLANVAVEVIVPLPLSTWIMLQLFRYAESLFQDPNNDPERLPADPAISGPGSPGTDSSPSPGESFVRLARSTGVPCARRGYQPIGTEMVRPSSRSTESISSETITVTAPASASVPTAEGVHSCPKVSTFSSAILSISRIFFATVTMTSTRRYQGQPESRTLILPVHMHTS